MYNKVELCGVNTAELPILSEQEKRDLLTRARAGDKEARQSMIEGNLRLVLSVVQRFSQRGENMDDLFQVGCIGLIKAIDNFDPAQPVRFSTYGVPMIIGEIRRFLRDNNALRVSRSLRYKMIATGKPEELFVAPNKDVQEFVGDSVEFLPKDGVNVRLFFNDETASDSAITHLAHELGINFGICQGKLENFRGTIMGSLVINVTEADRERVTAWLTDRGILWEVLENV